MTSEKSYSGWYFLAFAVLVYILAFIYSPAIAYSALDIFGSILFRVLPIFALIFVLMSLTNYYMTPKKLVSYLGKGSGAKGWMIAIVSGILSTGPIYMWYPLLEDLKDQGMRYALISAFLYNRAVKIPLLPLLVSYFGLWYSIVLMLVMVMVSVLQGSLTEKMMEAIG